MESTGTLSLWKNAETKRFNLYKNKDDKHPLELGPGDSITWEGRDGYVKIVSVTGKDTDVGPMGFTYLPYRKEEGRWATAMFSLRGDPRFVICYPAGIQHYGLHLPLITIQKDEAPLLTHQKTADSIQFRGALVELRCLLHKCCWNADIVCVRDASTYQCSKDDMTFTVDVYKAVEGYHLELIHLTGSHTTFLHCKEALKELHR